LSCHAIVHGTSYIMLRLHKTASD